MSAQTEPDPRQWAEATRWLARADDDLRVVEMLMAQVSAPLLPAALHCQQAAEKMAKAVLIALNVAPPRIHDIETLGALIAARHADVGRTIAEMGELTTWYVSARYPDSMQVAPSAEEIGLALTKLQRLRQLVSLLAPQA